MYIQELRQKRCRSANIRCIRRAPRGVGAEPGRRVNVAWDVEHPRLRALHTVLAWRESAPLGFLPRMLWPTFVNAGGQCRLTGDLRREANLARPLNPTDR